ncbi:exosporium leader peptide-containing protein, partial [Bacillus thuringiensis]
MFNNNFSNLNVNLIGPTFPPIPPFTGITGITGPTGD